MTLWHHAFNKDNQKPHTKARMPCRQVCGRSLKSVGHCRICSKHFCFLKVTLRSLSGSCPFEHRDEFNGSWFLNKFFLTVVRQCRVLRNTGDFGQSEFIPFEHRKEFGSWSVILNQFFFIVVRMPRFEKYRWVPLHLTLDNPNSWIIQSYGNHSPMAHVFFCLLNSKFP